MLPNSLVPQHRRGSGFRISGKKKEGGGGAWGLGSRGMFKFSSFDI